MKTDGLDRLYNTLSNTGIDIPGKVPHLFCPHLSTLDGLWRVKFGLFLFIMSLGSAKRPWGVAISKDLRLLLARCLKPKHVLVDGHRCDTGSKATPEGYARR